MAEWYEFAAPQLLATALAEAVAERLRQTIGKKGQAVLAVSGGSTPATFFRALARKPLDWRSVTVVLVDERFVPPSSERSNERLVTLNLLQADAAAAKFTGLFGPGDITDAASRADARIAALGAIDVVVLGMGTDGHTASFFADDPNLAGVLDPENSTTVHAVQSTRAGEARLTLSLSKLTSAHHIFVHIEGLEKKEHLLGVLANDDKSPIFDVIKHAGGAVDIYWAPGETG